MKSRSRLIFQTNAPLGRVSRARRSRQLLSSPAGSGASLATWRRLTCPIPIQEQSNWCWCATTLGVRKYFQSSDTTTQCQAANQILTRADACANPSGVTVNIPYYLDRALSTFGHLRAPTVNAALSPSQVAQEIQTGVPVGTRIGWSGGGGHFMVIEGYLAAAVPRVAIHDPIYGKSEMDYGLYVSSYQGNGSWTHSYLIK